MDADTAPSSSPLRTFAAAWLAAALVWLCAIPLFGVWPFVSLLFPPIGLLLVKFHSPLWPFLAGPIVLALVMATVVARAVRSHLRRVFVRAVIANLVFLAAFVAGAEALRAWLIALEARAIGAQCHWSRTFMESVAERRERGEYARAHAMAAVGPRVFIWSYSERRFVPDSRDHGTGGCADMPGSRP